MPGAARLGDLSQCAADVHGCPGCPHPGIGPAIAGSPNVLINSRPAVRVDDVGIHAACCGSNMWTAVKGSATVFINGKPAHRMGDADRHCGGVGQMIQGSPNVIIGDAASGGAGSGGGGAGGGAAGGPGTAAGQRQGAAGGSGPAASSTGASGSGAGSGAGQSSRSASRPGPPGSPGSGTAAGGAGTREAASDQTEESRNHIYELTLLDESEAPLAFLPVTLNPPGQTENTFTDGNGRARLEVPPDGVGTASIKESAAILQLLMANLPKPLRLAPISRTGNTQVCSLKSLLKNISLPSDEPQRVLVVSRINVALFSSGRGWDMVRLTESGPWTIAGGPTSVLRLVADGSGRSLSGLWDMLFSPASPATSPAQPGGDAGAWKPPNIYVVQPGDTLTAIAARYLGDANRWREIWSLNQPRYAGRSPDLIYPGDEFVMPPEAVPPWLNASGQAASAPPPPPPEGSIPWGTLIPDDLLDALFNLDFDKAFEILKGLPIIPPELPLPPAPDCMEERIAFEVGMVDLTINGVEDPKDAPEDTDRGEFNA